MPPGQNMTHGDEHQAEIELPDLGDVAQHDLQVGDEHGAQDRTNEGAGAADEGGEQHVARLAPRLNSAALAISKLIGRKAARDAGEEGRTRQNAMKRTTCGL